MKIKNVSNKVIGIGGAALLPNEEMEFSGKLERHPVIRGYVKQGLVVTMKEAAVEEPAESAAGSEVANAGAAEVTGAEAAKSAKGSKKADQNA